MRQARIMVTVVVVLLIGAGMVSAGNPDFGWYQVPLTLEPPTIDGVIDEGEWDNAVVLESTGDGTDMVMLTHLLWDQEYLYAYSIIDEPYVWGTMSGRDEPLWQNDAIELFIDFSNSTEDTGRNEESFQFIFGAGGGFTDSIGSEDLVVNWQNWQSEGVEYAVTVLGTLNDHSDEDEGWLVEAKIPWSAMERENPPSLGTEVGFNAHVKSRRPGGPNFELNSSTGLGHVHDISTFHVIQFGPCPCIDMADGLLHYDFEDGVIPPYWLLSADTEEKLSIVEYQGRSVLQYAYDSSDPGYSVIAFGPMPQESFVYEMRFKLVERISAWWVLTFTNHSYAVAMRTPQAPAARQLSIMDRSSGDDIAGTAVNWQLGQWHHFKVVVDDGQMDVYVDDQHMLNVELEEPLRGGLEQRFWANKLTYIDEIRIEF